jgi:hypothetical protein
MEEIRDIRRAERDWERRAEQYREEKRREIVGERSSIEKSRGER